MTGPCTRTDANGNSTFYTYDADNRILTKRYGPLDI
jgi:YD repeat-containing protein